MILRLWHLIRGHRWVEESRAFNDPGVVMLGVPLLECEQRHAWGFTEVSEHCSCGARRVYRLIGKHGGQEPADSEVAQLRKLAGLK